jgi:uncharacterized delta-60 repeat protein
MKFAHTVISFSSTKKVGFYILCGINFLFYQNLFAQPGTLDKSFGSNGIVINEPGVKNTSFCAIAIQTDAKIVAAGYSTIGQYLDFLIARYDTNGSLDGSFGVNGKVTTTIGAGSCSIHSLHISSDGKMIVAGYAYYDTIAAFALAKYTYDGSLDTSFGTGGIVITSFGENSISSSSAIQEDGKIVLAGYSGFSSGVLPGVNCKFALARYNPDGSLDSTFGINGKITTAVRTMDDGALSMGIQSDGKIVLDGYSYFQNGWNILTDIALVRYNINGILDTTFGIWGKVITEVGMSSNAHSLLILNDNKIVVCGSAYNGSKEDIVLVQYNTEGLLDTTFGINGIITTSIGSGDDKANCLLLQPDNKILVTGSTSNVTDGSKSNFAVVRYNFNGSLDNTFGSDGIAVTAIDTISSFRAAAIQADGKILAAGLTVVIDSVYNMIAYSVLTRYISGLPNGVVDLSISDNSLKIYPNPAEQKITLEYSFNDPENISIYLFNSLGQCEKTLILNQIQQPGNHSQKIILPTELSNGIYWIVLTTSKNTSIKSLIINNLNSDTE